MKERLNRFDRIAPLYDILKGLVFGKSIHKSQVIFIDGLPKDGHFLIIGGGSGEILCPLLKQNRGCTIWYVEASSRMLAMAAKRLSPQELKQVYLIHGTETSVPSGMDFDAVMTNFFLDLFPAGKLDAICSLIHARLKAEGIWLISDFVNPTTWWQRLLLKGMYTFFRITCGIEARELPAWETKVQASGMILTDTQLFYRGFIKSSVYIKGV